MMKKTMLQNLENKRAVSEIVAYALFIMIALGISVLVYTNLESFLPSELPECPEDLSLIITQSQCNKTHLNLTIQNRGLWNITAIIIRIGNIDSDITFNLNKNEELLPIPLSPGEEIGIVKALHPHLPVPYSGEKKAEVQAAIYERGKLYPCKNTLTKKTVDCS